MMEIDENLKRKTIENENDEKLKRQRTEMVFNQQPETKQCLIDLYKELCEEHKVDERRLNALYYFVDHWLFCYKEEGCPMISTEMFESRGKNKCLYIKSTLEWLEGVDNEFWTFVCHQSIENNMKILRDYGIGDTLLIDLVIDYLYNQVNEDSLEKLKNNTQKLTDMIEKKAFELNVPSQYAWSLLGIMFWISGHKIPDQFISDCEIKMKEENERRNDFFPELPWDRFTISSL